jgi:uncharacterized membrane protein YidH (DUF202 family)
MPEPKNPYATPPIAESVQLAETTPEWGIQSVARRVFLAWERLRLRYNAVLIAICLFTGFLSGAYKLPEFWIACVVAGIGANVCYFAGPITETYLTWLRKEESVTLRNGVFLVGLTFSGLLAVTGTIFVSLLGALNPQ